MTTTITPGEKIEFTGTLIYIGEPEVYRYGAKPSYYCIIKDEEAGVSYSFKSAANFSKHIKDFPTQGGMHIGNTMTFTATVKSVGTYKGSPSIKVTRPRLQAVEVCEYAERRIAAYNQRMAGLAPVF